jgi:hypothetical protein
MNYKNHFTLGYTKKIHKSKILPAIDRDILNDYLKSLEDSQIDIGYIPAGYEHRPDLISNYFYNTTTKDWLIVMFNNIRDPFQELNVGDRILIPRV